jgi:putative oxidoreductase
MVFQSWTRQLSESGGLALVRLVLGVVFVVSGVGKVLAIGPKALPVSDLAGLLGGLGLPAPLVLAWVVGIVELVGGVLLIVGLGTRLVGIALAIDMAVATALVHALNGFDEYEYTLVLTVCAVALVLGGPGVLSADRWVNRRALLGSGDGND